MDINVSRLLCFGIEVCEFGIIYVNMLYGKVYMYMKWIF